MADEKVYHPEEIIENPFPTELESIIPQSQTLPKDTYAPTVSKPNRLPDKKVAVELLSTALNTRSKRILKEFELNDSGGLRVGKFEEGVSGDLKITPNGITARDQAGGTTFAIDGTTGDAIFKGEIRAGSIITEGRIVNANGKIIVDESGLVSVENFASGSAGASADQTITNTTADINDTSQTFILERETKILLLGMVNVNLVFSTTNGENDVRINVDGNDIEPTSRFGGTHGSAHNTTLSGAVTLVALVSLEAGSHTIKLRMSNNNAAGAIVTDRNLVYIALGN